MAPGVGFRIDNQVITAHDVQTLRPPNYLNDKTVNAYIALLRARADAGEKRVFIASTYLFTKLCEGKPLSRSKRVAHRPPLAPIQACAKWHRKQPLLTHYAWFMMPVNHNEHWSLIAIINPAAYLAQHTPPDLLPPSLSPPPPQAARPSLIVSFDSLGFTYRTALPTIASYLAHRWLRELGHPDAVDEANSLALKIERDLPISKARVPQQENSYDCGCFMLHYLDLLTMPSVAAIIELHPRYWLTVGLRNWFRPEEAEAKRVYLPDLFARLQREQSALQDGELAIEKFVTDKTFLHRRVARASARMRRACRFVGRMLRWRAAACSAPCVRSGERRGGRRSASVEVVEEVIDLNSEDAASPRGSPAPAERSVVEVLDDVDEEDARRALNEERLKFNSLFRQPAAQKEAKKAQPSTDAPKRKLDSASSDGAQSPPKKQKMDSQPATAAADESDISDSAPSSCADKAATAQDSVTASPQSNEKNPAARKSKTNSAGKRSTAGAKTAGVMAFLQSKENMPVRAQKPKTKRAIRR